MGSTPWRTKAFVREGDNYPATYVSWEDTQEFCEKTGLRLPTEEEWEFACRGGSIGGDDCCFGNNAEDLALYAWIGYSCQPGCSPVGLKEHNLFGLMTYMAMSLNGATPTLAMTSNLSKVHLTTNVLCMPNSNLNGEMFEINARTTQASV